MLHSRHHPAHVATIPQSSFSPISPQAQSLLSLLLTAFGCTRRLATPSHHTTFHFGIRDHDQTVCKPARLPRHLTASQLNRHLNGRSRRQPACPFPSLPSGHIFQFRFTTTIPQPLESALPRPPCPFPSTSSSLSTADSATCSFRYGYSPSPTTCSSPKPAKPGPIRHQLATLSSRLGPHSATIRQIAQIALNSRTDRPQASASF